jgi:nitronate monooxygenase
VQGLIRDVPTVRELIDRIIREAEEILDRRVASMRAHT